MKNNEGPSSEKEIDILEYLYVIYKRKTLFLLTVLLILLFGFLYYKSQPRIYQSNAVILAMGESQSGGLSSLLGGALGGLGGKMSGGSTTSSKIILFLKSFSLHHKVVQDPEVRRKVEEYLKAQGDLDTTASKEVLDEAYAETIRGTIDVEDDPALGAMKVSAASLDARFSQYVLGAALKGLNEYLKDYNLEDAERNLDIIGKQLIQNRRELLEISKWLSNYYEHNSGAAYSSHIDVPIGLSKESEMVNGLIIPKQPAETSEIMRDIPLQVYLKYVQQQSDVLSNINRMLSQEYRMAIINNVKDTVSFKIIDKPTLQTSPVKPIFTYFLLATILLSLLLSTLVVFCAEYWGNIKSQLKGLGNQ